MIGCGLRQAICELSLLDARLLIKEPGSLLRLNYSADASATTKAQPLNHQTIKGSSLRRLADDDEYGHLRYRHDRPLKGA